MPNYRTWTLTDVDNNVYLENWSVTSDELGIKIERPFSIRKTRLKGGLRDGVDSIELNNGELSYTVLPTRGMSIWRGAYHGWRLGWPSPIRGPVHPSFVNEQAFGGIGWLQGFDEWIVRCGLSSNGAPGEDVYRDNNGNERRAQLPLHGHIANLPASKVEVRVNLAPPFEIEVIGRVEEAMLFFPQLQMTTVVGTAAGSRGMKVSDRITNVRSQPAEMQLLYHCNFGRPLMAPGARFLAPIKTLAPRDGVAAETLDHYETYPQPQSGIVEQCYFFELHGVGADQRTIAALCSGDKICAMRFSKKQLPWFTLWKNPGADSDGYVTGLEPATNLPNPRQFERKQGRVVQLAAGASYDCQIEFEVADSPDQIQKIVAEIETLQAASPPTIHKQPMPKFSDVPG